MPRFQTYENTLRPGQTAPRPLPFRRLGEQLRGLRRVPANASQSGRRRTLAPCHKCLYGPRFERQRSFIRPAPAPLRPVRGYASYP